MAWHGTSFENLWSILHHGLLNMSGTRMQRVGAAFGEGIYLTPEYSVAFAFAQGSKAWEGSALGVRLRCLLLCSVDRELARAEEKNDVAVSCMHACMLAVGCVGTRACMFEHRNSAFEHTTNCPV